MRAFFFLLSSAIFGLSMSKNYTQLSCEQRYQIEALLEVGLTQKSIAERIGVSPSTICRELKRNIAKRGMTAGDYTASNAIRRTTIRHKSKPKRVIFNDQIKQIIVYYLKVEHWSPELISKCLESVPISHEWIYQWIWTCKHTNTSKNRAYKDLYKYLRHGRRKRKRGNYKDNRGIIKNRTSIEKRPAIVAKRKRIGDIEVDLMMGKNHQGAILVMTDRATLQTRLRKLKDKGSKEVSKAIKSLIRSNPFKTRTLTFDNDLAFSCHNEIAEEFSIKTYFTRPYTSQDKGTVENRIGVLRRFFPKKTNLTFVSGQMVGQIERKLNNRPVRKFNYKTPNQVLQKKIALIT